MSVTKLEKRVAQWVRAEYEFRCGPRAYQADTTAWYLKATEKLRKALTGKRDLGQAWEALKGAPNEKGGA